MVNTAINYSTVRFDTFDVHNLKDNYSFFHINIKDSKLFLKGLVEYILNEDKLLRYAENKSGMMFKPTQKNYVTLFRELNNFIDDENIESFMFDIELEDVFRDEFKESEIDEKEGIIRLSKIGRIGEYIFHIFLSEYFNFNCIIPKVKLTTDKNMSVYGIDALFLDRDNEMILFGESKVTNKIENGIAMVKKSLKNYENEIREEYMLVLTNNQLKLSGLEEVFPGQTEICLTFDDFIEGAQIKNIGIPVFIAHGTEIDSMTILDKLATGIKRKQIFELNTVYYVISLPIIGKNTFFSYITNVIREKMEDIHATNIKK